MASTVSWTYGYCASFVARGVAVSVTVGMVRPVAAVA